MEGKRERGGEEEGRGGRKGIERRRGRDGGGRKER